MRRVCPAAVTASVASDTAPCRAVAQTGCIFAHVSDGGAAEATRQKPLFAHRAPSLCRADSKQGAHVDAVLALAPVRVVDMSVVDISWLVDGWWWARVTLSLKRLGPRLHSMLLLGTGASFYCTRVSFKGAARVQIMW